MIAYVQQSIIIWTNQGSSGNSNTRARDGGKDQQLNKLQEMGPEKAGVFILEHGWRCVRWWIDNTLV